MAKPKEIKQRRGSTVSLLLSTVAATVVFGILFSLQARTADTASAVVALDEDQVTWPYFDAVRQTATGAIASSPEALAAANRGAAPGSVEELTTEIRDGQSFFAVTAKGSDSAAAATGVDNVISWARDQNLMGRSGPLTAEKERLSALLDSLAFDYESAQDGDDVLAGARATELASLIAQYERRILEIDQETAKLLPQFNQVEPAKPASNPLRPILSAIGAFFAALAAFTLLDPFES